MSLNLDTVVSLIGKVLAFPLVFQEAFLRFAWGAQDPFFLMCLKRAMVLLPVLGFVMCCWLTAGSIATLPFRSKRERFVSSLISTWWDFGRALATFWGGAIRFAYDIAGSAMGLVRIFGLGVLLFTQDILLFPVRVAQQAGKEYIRPGVPWIAVLMTLGWCLLEAGVFSYVTLPMVTDVLSAIHDGEASGKVLPYVLYAMMLAFVLGSYSILSAWGTAIKEKDFSKIVQIGVFEVFVMCFEVLFLYREFVDSLVPWLNQYTTNQNGIGLVPILLIAGFAWLGIRGMTWFLFASSGTPTIMAIIQRSGLPGASTSSHSKEGLTKSYIKESILSIRREMDWVEARGEQLLAAFILPPLQIVGACINFCTLLVLGKHMFSLPFKTMEELTPEKPLVDQISEEEERKAA